MLKLVIAYLGMTEEARCLSLDGASTLPNDSWLGISTYIIEIICCFTWLLVKFKWLHPYWSYVFIINIGQLVPRICANASSHLSTRRHPSTVSLVIPFRTAHVIASLL